MNQENKVFQCELENGEEVSLTELDLKRIFYTYARNQFIDILNTAVEEDELCEDWSETLIEELAAHAEAQVDIDEACHELWERFIDNAIRYIRENFESLHEQYERDGNDKAKAALEEFDEKDVWRVSFYD